MLNNVMTLKEAGQLWGVSSSALRSAIQSNKFDKEGINNSGSIWLVSVHAMTMKYGTIFERIKKGKIKDIDNLASAVKYGLLTKKDLLSIKEDIEDDLRGNHEILCIIEKIIT